ncbi:hypothetical protein ANME2D_01186 [Candidatus Methanoperedens nitroreducens]|uniref:DUF5714 domain-containing protein n=1 Tax=Candidatus Methanoperedens nitratireducens TaxID=1392998 RepID=A0A062V600_9EURY|nr:DUF5714 domain-containing protein [Candidatus Methanoperedens nitroreducens]KCZ72752.1 hypothetical protein ANME2D_01186 [Candidatus Methanoperedens nitroreducens]MDJ1423315.1 DUF5714 domain-containing protein [Candidatus Methanoperedens sp.]
MDYKKTENCMICGEELAYLTAAIGATCTYCGRAESANIHCPSGHYVCNECHARDSIQIITRFCQNSGSTNPMEMAKTIMKHPTMPMHGPEHHAMIAAVLVTAYKNLTGKVTDEEIKEAIRRGATVPGGYCGLYGADAAAIATGIAMSTILKASPLTDHERRTANMMTSRALAAIAINRGVRCCKRSTFAAIESAIQYFREVLGTELEHTPVSKLKCEHSSRNKQCARADCRYYAGEQ